MNRNNKVTIKEVAALAGVSVSTVSRVLNGRDVDHMRVETKAKVLRAIQELGYTPVKAARALRRQRSQLVAILVPDISNPFFSLLARGVASVAFENGYSSLICDSNHSVDKESQYLDILLAERVEGIVFVPVGRPDMKRIERLLWYGAKVVVADRRVDGLPVVEADNRSGSRELTQYVLSLGYHNIAYIAGPKMVSTAEDRLLGFREAMQEADLTPVVIHHGNFTYESGYKYTQKILREFEVDAILCGNDLMAIGAIRAAEDLGFRVPEQLGIAGFDYVPWSKFLRPALTSVAVPAYEMGRRAAGCVLGSASACVLPVSLVKGATVTVRRKGVRSGKSKK